MKFKRTLALSCVVSVIAWTSQASITIANWTFETSQPTTSGPISPEVGGGTAIASSSGVGSLNSPVGNGSAHSYSGNNWAVGDYWQFQVSSVGYTGIKLSWDQTSSGTGPRDFIVKYSTDGSIFSSAIYTYSVLANVSPNPVWNGTTASSLYSYTVDLSADTAYDGISNLYFRLIDNSTTSASGATVATTGTDRIDNFLVTAESAVVPEPSTYLAGLLLALPFGVHGVRYLRNRKRA